MLDEQVAQPPKHAGGRPSDYCAETAEAICLRLAQGESLRAICRDDGMPATSTVLLWVIKHPKFSEQYTRAREAQADTLVDEILEISDDGSNDWMERKSDDGQAIGWSLNGEHVQRSRLRVDSRKWFASKVLPKKYGDRVQAEVSGPDGKPVETITRIVREIVRPKETGS